MALLLPTVCLLLAWALCRLSGWTGALAIGCSLLVVGLLARGLRRAPATGVLAAGVVLVTVPIVVRAASVSGTEHTRLTTLPPDSGARLISRLYPEADGTLAAAGLLALSGGLRDPETAEFRQILERAYARTHPNAATVPSPAIATYLGLQSPNAFDTLVIQPRETRAASDGAVVFLHGYAGNFYVYCWEMAQAAAAARLITLCPSTDAAAAWWNARGAETLDATLRYAHAIGVKRVYLAGLSNGAAGASVLALTRARRLAGLVLVSGVRAQHPPALPVLLVHGAGDQMMPAAAARAYAARSSQARYYEVPGGHFVFLSEHERVRRTIAEFLTAIERRALSESP